MNYFVISYRKGGVAAIIEVPDESDLSSDDILKAYAKQMDFHIMSLIGEYIDLIHVDTLRIL